MKARLFHVFVLVMSLALILPPAVTAQGPEPPAGPHQPPGPPEGPGGPWQQSPDGHWFMTSGGCPPPGAAGGATLSTGGPDDFGYTWDDSVLLNWIGATGGTDTGMSGSSSGKKVGPIPLPFAFKYYENTYSQLYIAASGYLAFTDEGTWPWQPGIPSPAKPNNVIAPYATPLNLAASGPANRVYYTSGGTAPNRYFVVEWYQVVFYDETYTYEVILYENGDIVFQYQAMTYNDGYACGAAGIEDSTGLDGLAYVDFCHKAPSNKAVRFTRPAPSARVSITPLYQGRFTRGSETVAFQVSIRNTGDLGADVYDLTISSSWLVSLFAADGTTPLTDTDGDGTVDTGSVAQGGTFTVTVKVQTPVVVNVGDGNTANVTARSSLNTSKSKMATLQTAVPAPFAQVYRDEADGAMSLYLAQPGAQTLKKITSDWYYGYEPAVAEMPSSFAYFWDRERSVGSVYVNEIEYTLLDRYGNTVRGVTKLTDHSGATMYTYDYPVVAAAPNGRIGVLWYRYLERQSGSTWQFNYNVFFAILDAAGNLAYGPLNLTNNNTWGTWSDYNIPYFVTPRIAATGDNRFMLAWWREHQEASGWVDNVWYAVRDANGGQVKGVTKFTNDAPGGDYYGYPALAALSGNRALLAYYAPGGIAYAVLDSGGNTVKAETSTGSDGWGPDAVQLSTGKVVIAWSGSMHFAVLDGTTYNVTAGPTALNNPAAVTGDAYVSVATDAAGHAILTWMDSSWSYRRNLYYALVDGNGNVLTPPVIFRTSQAATPRIETSYEGYGNTSWSVDLTPPTNPTSLTSPSHTVGVWSADNTVDVVWSGAADAGSGVDGYSVLWDNAPTTIPDAIKDVEETVSNATSPSLGDGNWYFHIRTVDNAGNWAADAVHLGPFRIDRTPPSSAAYSPAYAVGSFPVTWNGSDAGSGIASYDVQVRDGTGGTWTTWLASTTATSATYTAGVTGHTYYFRSVAYDAVGNVETALPADGDTHTTLAAYQAAGQVFNNRHEPVFNATVVAQPTALNTATTNGSGSYTLYFGGSGTYALGAGRSGYGVLPPRYGVAVTSDRSGLDFVLPPANEAVTNGGWETGDLSGWTSGPGVTPTVSMTATHTGQYGVELGATGVVSGFQPYLTQAVSIPVTWSQPTLSFLYRVQQGSPGDMLLATISDDSTVITHSVVLTPGEWTHTWCDVSAFRGYTATLQFGFQDSTGTPQVCLDEISLGDTATGVFPIYLPLVMRTY